MDNVVLLSFLVFLPVIVAILLAFFPVTENTIAGLSGVDRGMVELTKSLGGSALLVFRKVSLPFSLRPFW